MSMTGDLREFLAAKLTELFKEISPRAYELMPLLCLDQTTRTRFEASR